MSSPNICCHGPGSAGAWVSTVEVKLGICSAHD